MAYFQNNELNIFRVVTRKMLLQLYLKQFRNLMVFPDEWLFSSALINGI